MTTVFLRNLLFLSGGLFLLGGCATTPPQHDEAYSPTLPLASHAPPPRDGSIYHAGYDIVLFEDNKARRVGDLLTINLVEKTDATKKAATKAAKSNTVDIPAPTLLGRPVLGGAGANLLQNSVDAASTFEGSGDSSQSNSLSGSITVTVSEVLPNGYLVVRGDKVIGLNQGDEYVRLSGIIRPADIRADNTVPSTAVGNATILYGGNGTLADANTMGWLGRFFLSRLFPF